jgi:peptide/nickel transport system substrate-binding protein
MDDKGLWNKFELKHRSKKLKKHAKKAEGATIRHARKFVFNRWENIREVRLHIIGWLGGVGLLIAIVGMQMLWFQQSYITTAAVSGGTYAEALRGPVDTLDPLYATSPAEIAASRLLFSSLYALDTSGSVKGDLATSMANDSDKVFTVTMRKDAKWHDGQKVTADDVVFTVGLMKDPSARAVMNASWRGIDVAKVNEYTVQFTLPAAYAAFPQALTFSVLPEHLLKTIDPVNLRESGFSDAPIGSGPFSLRLLQTIDETSGRRVIHLASYQDHYAGTPRIDRMQLHVYDNDEAIARALRTGEVSAASDVSGATAETIDRNRYETIIKPANSGVYAIFNSAQPLLKDPKIRKALQVGTDTRAIRAALYENPDAMDLPFIKRQVPGSEALQAPAYDPTAAKKILYDNGWVQQGDVRIKGQERLQINVVTRKNSDFEKALSVISGQWRQLGFDVQTQVVENGQEFAQQILQQRGYDVLLDKLVIGSDPDVFAYWHTKGPQNFSSYSNETSDDALASARARSDRDLRAVKYIAFAKRWLEDAPAIGLYQSDFIYVQSKSVSSLTSDEVVVDPNEHYAGVKYWTADRGRVYRTP